MENDITNTHNHECPFCERIYKCEQPEICTAEYRDECIYCWRDGERDLSA